MVEAVNDEDDKKPANLPIAIVIEVSVVGSIAASKIPELQEMADAVLVELTRRFEGRGAKVFPRWSEVRPATRDELLSFIPRKMHYTEDGDDHACDTMHVSRKNLTKDMHAVTCKLCLRFLGARGLL